MCQAKGVEQMKNRCGIPAPRKGSPPEKPLGGGHGGGKTEIILRLERIEQLLLGYGSPGSVTKQDLLNLEKRIMTAISDFKTAVDVKFDELDASVTDLQRDITFVKAEIERIQNSPGPISPEDQSSLDAVQARLNSMATNVASLPAQTQTPPTP